MKTFMTEEQVAEKLAKYENAQIRDKIRFEMMNKDTYKKILSLNAFFNRYVITYSGTFNHSYIYYDTENKDLEKSGISLFKEIKKNSCNLIMARMSLAGEKSVLERLANLKFSTPIGVNESLTKKMEFMTNSFQEMFAGSINFDAEYLLLKLTRSYEINTNGVEYKLFNGSGLKVKILFDFDKYKSYYTGREVEAYLATFYQLSNKETDPFFKDVVGKLVRYCKELTDAEIHKTDIIRRKTRPTVEMEIPDDELYPKKEKKLKNK